MNYRLKAICMFEELFWFSYIVLQTFYRTHLARG